MSNEDYISKHLLEKDVSHSVDADFIDDKLSKTIEAVNEIIKDVINQYNDYLTIETNWELYGLDYEAEDFLNNHFNKQ